MTKTSVSRLFLALAILAFSQFAFGQTAKEHLKAGDEYYAQFDDANALEEYLLAAQTDPNNYEALWKTARAYVDVGDQVDPKAENAKEKRIKNFVAGEDYAKKAIKVNPNDTWGHFQAAAAMGKHVLLLGKSQQIDMSKKIKAEIDKAIALDPNNDLAYHALGRWHRRMAEISGLARLGANIFLLKSVPKGTFEESKKYLKKAIELKPTYGNHHMELGRTLLALKKYKEAAQEFQACIDAPIITSKCQMYKKEAESELAAANKKIK